MEKFVKVLNEMQEVSAWKITSVQRKSCELFYVLDKLETNRATNVTNYNVTIYVDKEDKRGSSSFSVYDYQSEDELKELIKKNVFAAGFALNPFYEIPGKEEAKIEESKSNIKGQPLKNLIGDVVKAVFKANVYEKGYLSATEFFLYETTTRIVNSKGVDVTDVSYSGNVELIPSWEDNGEEVEIYHMMKFESIDLDKITKEVDEQLLLAKARFEAKNLEVKENIKVILQDVEASQIFSYWGRDLNYASKYNKMNKFELGENVQGDNVTGTVLNLKMVPYYENAMKSAAFDSDGVVLKEVELVKDGVAVNQYGSYTYGYYLGVDHPTGNIPVAVVEPGTKSFAEMAKEPYIRCATFSGMQLEPNSGFFGGEVRLGFYFDGEKEIPVTGFSISGNINEAKGTIVYSSDVVTLENYHGPKYLEIKGMKIM